MALVVAAAVLAAATLLVDRTAVEVGISDAAAGRVLWRGVVAAGEVIELHYTHSVEQTPVVEVFRAAPEGLRLVEMRFVSQGAGLPTEGFVREGGQFVLRTDRRVGALPVRVSALAGQRLHVGSSRLDLVGLAADGAGLVIAARPAVRLRWPGSR